MHVTLGLSGQHTDITNYYIFMGVIGGLPAMVLLMAMMWRAFRSVGHCSALQSSHHGADALHDLVPGSRFVRACLHQPLGRLLRPVDDVFLVERCGMASMHSVLTAAARRHGSSRLRERL